FLSAIAAGDDVARLAYADWLEERGDPRAGWVRDERIFEDMLPDGRGPVAAMLAAAQADDQEEAPRGREAPSQVGAPVVPALLDLLESRKADEWPGEVIGAMGREAVEPHLPRLLALAADPDWDAHHPAVLALKAVGSAAAAALPTLLRLLPSDDDV